MDAPFLLAIDSGNSHIKWGLHDGRGWLEHGIVKQENRVLLAEAWRNLAEPSRIVVSNVAGMQAGNALADLLSPWRTEPQWVIAAQYQCGVRNYYADPAQLGSDRWAALIAAWESEAQGCLVVDAGTAMTVDALSDTGEFLGGIIIPGVDMMHKVLMAELSFLQSGKGEFCDYPDSTADAVYSGLLHALAGAIERMSALLAGTLGRVPDCILSGGTAAQLQPRLNLNVKVVDNLVLQGLLAIARVNPEALGTPGTSELPGTTDTTDA